MPPPQLSYVFLIYHELLILIYSTKFYYHNSYHRKLSNPQIQKHFPPLFPNVFSQVSHKTFIFFFFFFSSEAHSFDEQCSREHGVLGSHTTNPEPENNAHTATSKAQKLETYNNGAMVVHGHDTTLPITVDEMLVHCRAVARGAKNPLLVGDLPFGSYESSSNQAVDTAVRILKEGGMDAIKLEGGSPSRIVAAKAIVEAGIAVMGHVGLTPQAISVLGGFRPQGRNISSAVKVVETALALQEAGCFSVVLECVPPPVAAAATAALQIPTIGIGAGPFCSGQVLVYHDLLGMLQHPHHAKVTPKFCKQYARIGDVINKALLEYKEEVTNGSFPDARHSPYKISEADAEGFSNELQKLGFDEAASASFEAVQKLNATK